MLRRVDTAPADPLLDLADLKARLRFDPASTVDDAALAAFLEAATAALDGPDGWLGRALRPQSLELAVDAFPWCWDALCLPCPPVSSVDAVTYVDGNGTQRSMTSVDWTLLGRDLYPAAQGTWPSAMRAPGAVRIRYRAGYDVAPAPIVQAVVLGVAAMCALARGDVLSSETVVGVYARSWAAGGDEMQTKAAMALLSPFRVFDA